MRMEYAQGSAESLKHENFAAVAMGLASTGEDRSPSGHSISSDEFPRESQIISPVLTKPHADFEPNYTGVQ